MTITEKVAYLKGLAEGMEITADTKEGKLLNAIVDVLSDMALDLEDLADDVTELAEHVDAIDEDLDTLENDFYDEDYDDEDYDEFDDEDDGFYDVTCPACGEEFAVDEETLLEGSIACPECGENLEFDLDECDGDCGSCDADCDEKE